MGLIVSWDAEKHIFSHCFDYIQRKVEDMVFTFFTLPIAFEMLQICRWIVCTQCCTKHWIGFYWRSSECGSTHFFAKHFPNRKKCCISVNLVTIRAIPEKCCTIVKFGHNSSKELGWCFCRTLTKTNKAKIHFSQKCLFQMKFGKYPFMYFLDE